MKRMIGGTFIIFMIFTCIFSTNVLASGDVGVTYQAHVQNIGWQPSVADGQLAGTEGQSLRMEALKVNLTNAPAGANIKYEAHVANIGWQSWVNAGQEAGTTGQGLWMEAIKIDLENLPGYSVEYRCHVQGIGWMSWVKDGETAGTTGQSLRIEAIEIRLVNADTPTSIITLGGLGDGVFDNTAVIQSAEDQGLDIYFPDGTYRINGYILKKNSSWYGQSKLGTILLYDNDFKYKSPSILDDSLSPDSQGSPLLRTEFSDDVSIKTDDYSTFTMQDFTLKWRVTADWLSPNDNADLWYVGNCKNLVLRNLYFDSNDPTVVGTAFFTTKGAVDGLLIEGCTFIQDSNPLLGNSLGYGGALCLQNFSRTRGSYDFVIQDNQFIKKHGSDECLWVSASSNCIDGIKILNNRFDVTSNDPNLGFQSTAIRVLSGTTTNYSTPGKAYVDNINIVGNIINGGTFGYSVIAVHESEDQSMPPINYVNVSDNVINATTNFNVKGYTSSACAIALEGKGTVDSIAENNTIAGNFEAGISGFKTVNNNHLDITDCNQGIRGAKTAAGNVVNISGIGIPGI